MGEARRRGLLSTARPLPSLSEHLGEIRAEGFENYVAQILRDREWLDGAGTDEQRVLVRMLQAMGVAAVESLRQSTVATGPDGYLMAIKLLPRAMGHTAMTATAGILSDDAPFDAFATMLIEEFRFGARQAADQLARMNGDET